MSASSRVVFGRAFRRTPAWVWWGQRLSGLALGPLVAIHALAPAMGRQRWLLALLLVSILVHGYSGLRRIAPAVSQASRAVLLAWAWSAVVAVAGMLVMAGMP